MRVFSVFFILLLLYGCADKSSYTKDKNFSLDSIVLKNKNYYFGTKKEYQILKRFDLIFVGHNTDSSLEKFKNLSKLIPGKYTHVLMYIGKDKSDFAYAIEMNADKKQTFKIDKNGIKIGGKLYFYCLGSDFNQKICPKNNYTYGLKSYDYMLAKRVNTDTRKFEKELLLSIKEDYKKALSFQLPLKIDSGVQETKTITLLSDGRENGASCAEYFVSLFEDVMGICINNVRINAKNLQNYYIYDKLGQQAYIPLRYNIFLHKKIYLKELFGNLGYKLEDNTPKKSKCENRVGIVTPDLLFKALKSIKIHHNPYQ